MGMMQPRSMTDVVVLCALPEIGQNPPTRRSFSGIEVKAAALQCLVWGSAIGMDYPEKATAIVRKAYGAEAEMRIPGLEELVQGQLDQFGSRFEDLSIDIFLPESLGNAAPSISYSGYDAWELLVGEYLVGCLFGRDNEELVEDSWKLLLRSDASIFNTLRNLRTVGVDVPQELIETPPTTPDEFIESTLDSVNEMLRVCEEEFGPLA